MKKIYDIINDRYLNKKDIHFFKKNSTDKQKRKILDQVGKKNDMECVILENLSYPKGLSGYMFENKKMRCVYDREIMIEDIMDELKCNVEDACEWLEYNSIRGCVYCYTDNAPCPIIISYEEDE